MACLAYQVLGDVCWEDEVDDVSHDGGESESVIMLIISLIDHFLPHSDILVSDGRDHALDDLVQSLLPRCLTQLVQNRRVARKAEYLRLVREGSDQSCRLVVVGHANSGHASMEEGRCGGKSSVEPLKSFLFGLGNRPVVTVVANFCRAT